MAEAKMGISQQERDSKHVILANLQTIVITLNVQICNGLTLNVGCGTSRLPTLLKTSKKH